MWAASVRTVVCRNREATLSDGASRARSRAVSRVMVNDVAPMSRSSTVALTEAADRSSSSATMAATHRSTSVRGRSSSLATSWTITDSGAGSAERCTFPLSDSGKVLTGRRW